MRDMWSFRVGVSQDAEPNQQLLFFSYYKGEVRFLTVSNLPGHGRGPRVILIIEANQKEPNEWTEKSR